MARDRVSDDFTEEELSRLTEGHREAVLRARTHTYELAAESLGLPIGTFKSRITRARARLGKLRGASAPPDAAGNAA